MWWHGTCFHSLYPRNVLEYVYTWILTRWSRHDPRALNSSPGFLTCLFVAARQAVRNWRRRWLRHSTCNRTPHYTIDWHHQRLKCRSRAAEWQGWRVARRGTLLAFTLFASGFWWNGSEWLRLRQRERGSQLVTAQGEEEAARLTLKIGSVSSSDNADPDHFCHTWGKKHKWRKIHWITYKEVHIFSGIIRNFKNGVNCCRWVI